MLLAKDGMTLAVERTDDPQCAVGTLENWCRKGRNLYCTTGEAKVTYRRSDQLIINVETTGRQALRTWCPHD